jgi:proteic killer suppression protein
MIVSFRNKDTKRLYEGKRVKEFQPFERIALRKLRQLQIAECLDDLRVPPGNRLELLHGDREGQYSMRINNRYRLCFVWMAGGPHEVEIVDYH